MHLDFLSAFPRSIAPWSASKQQSNFEAIRYAIREVRTRCAWGGWVWNRVFNSILPSPDPFGNQEDDATSINLPCIIDQLAEMGKRWQLHPLRHVTSNILSRLGIVTVDALPGVLDWNYSWCNLRYCSKQPECDHLFCNVPQELLHLLSDVT